MSDVPSDPSDARVDASGNRRTSQPSGRRWLFRLVAAGIPILVGLVLVAIVLVYQQRLVIDPQKLSINVESPPLYLEEPGHEKTGHRYLYDPRFGWRNIPNWRATTFGRKLTINSQGLRDREYPFEKPRGVHRILILGDSYCLGLRGCGR